MVYLMVYLMVYQNPLEPKDNLQNDPDDPSKSLQTF